MSLSFEAFIDHISGRGIRPGLGRMRSAIEKLDLHDTIAKKILVGGTNGKGSTAKKLESALRASGGSTYLYSSPHLISFEERFRFNGRVIGKDALQTAHRRCLEALPDGETKAGLLTPFEWMTLVGAWGAREKDSEFWILEVGLGGRLDAVNAFEPDLSIISSIDLDHCAQLGDSLQSIAGEKMGILRPGKKALIGAGAQPWVTWPEGMYEGIHFGRDEDGYRGLSGGHTWWGQDRQDSSASLAMAGTEALLGSGNLKTAMESIKNSEWPARFQAFREDPPGIMDGAHNPAAAAWLRDRFQATYPDLRVHLVLGVREDKNVEGIVAALEPIVHTITAVEDRGGYLMRSPALMSRIQRCSPHPVNTTDEPLGVCTLQCEGPVLVTGSLYLCGELVTDLHMEESLVCLN
jgi:dihydrofolate synthase/folylpolyglutamate synthase